MRLGRRADHFSARACHRLQFLHVLQPHAGSIETAKAKTEGVARRAAAKSEAEDTRSD